jgi:hypothetical protein
MSLILCQFYSSLGGRMQAQLRRDLTPVIYSAVIGMQSISRFSNGTWNLRGFFFTL